MSLPSKLDKILKAIPKDGWASAGDIAKKSGLSTHTVGALIGVNLLNKSVERKARPKCAGRSYVYKQLVRAERTGRNKPTEHTPEEVSIEALPSNPKRRHKE